METQNWQRVLAVILLSVEFLSCIVLSATTELAELNVKYLENAMTEQRELWNNTISTINDGNNDNVTSTISSAGISPTKALEQATTPIYKVEVIEQTSSMAPEITNQPSSINLMQQPTSTSVSVSNISRHIQPDSISLSYPTKATKQSSGKQSPPTTARPPDCSQREKLKTQPVYSSNARLQKCCALGEGLDIYRENQSDSICDTSQIPFEPNIINAVLYDNCIEDIEVPLQLEYNVGNPCNSSFIYDNNEDAFYVLQDGSLLVFDKAGKESYFVEKNYCLDVDKSGQIFAFVCITQVEEHLARSQMLTVAVLMLVSMPCLLIVSYLHISLRQLRTLNGLSLSLMSLCLAAGYFLHSVVHIYNIPSSGFIGYMIQFFILSYFFWFFCLCCNVLLNIWYKLPYNVQLSKTMGYINFAVYCLVAFSLPGVLVSLTVQKGLQGTPSYFIQGLTESIRDSQRYFIPPVSGILGLSFLVMIGSFFGFQRIKKYSYIQAEKEETLGVTVNTPSPFDQQKYEEVKKDAKCISLLGIIMITTWLLEIVTFYSPGPEAYLILCDMINGLQGVFVLLIFLVVRRRRTIILRWWYDRGSHNLVETGTELNTIATSK